MISRDITITANDNGDGDSADDVFENDDDDGNEDDDDFDDKK